MDKMMSQQEAVRGQVMELLKERKVDQKEAAKRLDVSVRQIKRIVKQYRTSGLAGLISKKRGIPSNRRMTEATRLLVTETIGAHYADFGPTLACEKLQERHGITLSVESTRKLMMTAGFWKPRQGAVTRRATRWRFDNCHLQITEVIKPAVPSALAC